MPRTIPQEMCGIISGAVAVNSEAVPPTSNLDLNADLHDALRWDAVESRGRLRIAGEEREDALDPESHAATLRRQHRFAAEEERYVFERIVLQLREHEQRRHVRSLHESVPGDGAPKAVRELLDAHPVLLRDARELF